MSSEDLLPPVRRTGGILESTTLGNFLAWPIAATRDGDIIMAHTIYNIQYICIYVIYMYIYYREREFPLRAMGYYQLLYPGESGLVMLLITSWPHATK